MRALVWHGKEDIRCDTVSDPAIENSRDAVIKVTSCAICGSDLHLFHNLVPAMLPGVISIIGVYLGLADKIPMGQAMNKGLTFRMAQAHVPRWTEDLLHRIEDGQIDPSFVITHKANLSQGPEMYAKFRDKADGCIKVMLQP
jgi:threonine dehydrogenase-like Zn-dependent dehydrogenase